MVSPTKICGGDQVKSAGGTEAALTVKSVALALNGTHALGTPLLSRARARQWIPPFGKAVRVARASEPPGTAAVEAVGSEKRVPDWRTSNCTVNCWLAEPTGVAARTADAAVTE